MTSSPGMSLAMVAAISVSIGHENIVFSIHTIQKPTERTLRSDNQGRHKVSKYVIISFKAQKL